MVHSTGGYFLLGELRLVFGDDLEGVQGACQGGLGPNALNRIFVEDVVNPGDLRDLVGRVSHAPCSGRVVDIGVLTGAKYLRPAVESVIKLSISFSWSMNP